MTERERSTSERALIMMVDDEPAITDSLGYSLRNAGFNSIAAATLAGADQLLSEHGELIRLVILDLSLPDGHGFDWLKRLRNISPLPVIILSSHDDEIEHIVGLEIGADDFIDKPFSPREVVARVRAILRRSTQTWSNSVTPVLSSPVLNTSSSSTSTSHEISSPMIASTDNASKAHQAHSLHINEGVWIDYDQYRVICDNVSLGLSQQEFSLFDAICSGRGRVFTRANLLRVAWDGGVSVSERTVDVHITSLRKKWAEHHSSELIETIRGVGYRLADGAPMIRTRGVKPS